MKSPSSVAILDQELGKTPFKAMLSLILLSVALAGFVALFSWNIWQEKGQLEQQVELSARTQAQMMGDTVAKTIDRTNSVLNVAIEQYKLYADGKISRESMNSTIKRVASRLDSPLGLCITDKNGNVVYGEAGRAEGRINIADRSYFLRLRDNQKEKESVNAMQPGFSKIGDQLVVIFAKRINDTEGDFAGIAYTTIPMQSLIKLGAVDIGRHGIIELRDAQEILVGRIPENSADGATDIPAEFKKTRIAGDAFSLIVGLDTNDFLQPWKGNLVKNGIALLILIVTYLVCLKMLLQANRQKAESYSQMIANEQLFRSVFENAPVGMELVSLNGELLRVNHALCKMLGYSLEELTGKSLQKITHPEDHVKDKSILDSVLHSVQTQVKAERRYIDRQGETIWVQRTVTLARDRSGAPLYLITQIEDITQRKEHQKHLHDIAYYDTLTKLPNRRMLMEKLAMAVHQARWSNLSIALMFIDLDGFKKINDTLGHDIGDELLKAAAQRMSACVRGEDMVARQGGDEFVIILSEMEDPDNAALVARKVVDMMKMPVRIEKQPEPLHVTASIGIAIYRPDADVGIEELLKQADTAMYCTKQSGRNGFTFYKESMASSNGAIEQSPSPALEEDPPNLWC